MPHPTRVINAVAPIRICDLGGWTDTWFAEYGRLLNIAVYPYVQCQVVARPRKAKAARLTFNIENYGDRYTINPAEVLFDRHPLLEAAVSAMNVPRHLEVTVTLFSQVPAGCSTGTSAAVTTALIGALDALTPGRLTPGEVAAKAHEVETKLLKLQCGIQDQIASAYGGINYIEMTRYPDARVSPVNVPNSIWWELESRLSLFFMGKSHKSSQIHTKVIHELEGAGPDSPLIEALRGPAERGKNALFAGDFQAFGQAMRDNTEAQQHLNKSLVSPLAREVIATARRHGALGWKVNGAGGDGGSMTLLSGNSPTQKRKMVQAIEAINPGIKHIPIYLSRFGLRVWETT